MSLETAPVRGTVNHYGPRDEDMRYGGTNTNRNGEIKVRMVFDYNELPEATTINLDHVIPSGSTILGANFNVVTAFTSTSTTTDLTVGLADADGGSNITDADGIFTAAELTQTVIAATGVTAASSGALIGATLSEGAVVTVAPNVDDLLTGRAILEITYQNPFPATYSSPAGT